MQEIAIGKKAIDIQFKSYTDILELHKIEYRQENPWLIVGEPQIQNSWVLYVSSVTINGMKVMEALIPVLKETGVAFRLIQGEVEQYNMNFGNYGSDFTGKFITIYPGTINAAVNIYRKIEPLLRSVRGIAVSNASRISNSIYINYLQMVNIDANTIGLQQVFSFDKHFPLKKEIEQYNPDLNRRLIAGRFIPTKLLRKSIKGNSYQGVSLKRFSFKSCLIKQGIRYAVDDHMGRDMTDRIAWQREVHSKLERISSVPKLLGYCEYEDSSFLITEFVEGPILASEIKAIMGGSSWKEIGYVHKQRILHIFLEILLIVGAIHSEGIVHRDITDSNFILGKDRIYIIDFELSYDVIKRIPKPQYVLGTDGYMAPEQREYAFPTAAEDTHSLGSLLYFMMTGNHPPSREITFDAINNSVETRLLYDLISKCRESNPIDRPTLESMIIEISEIINVTK